MIYVKTQSGSIYEVDVNGMRWSRIQETPDSGPLRTDGGALSCEPEIAMGQSMILLGPPINPFTWGRIILTTKVVEIRVVA